MALFLSWHSALVLFSICVLVSFLFNWPISFLVSLFHLVAVLYFVFFGSVLVLVCVCVCVCSFVFVSVYFYLSPFSFTMCLGFIFSFFVFLCICFCVFLNLLYYHDKELVGSWFGNQKLGLSLWGGSTKSRTLDHQRFLAPENINQ